MSGFNCLVCCITLVLICDVTCSTTPTLTPPTLTFDCNDGKISNISSPNNGMIVTYEPGKYCHINDPNCDWKDKFPMLHVMYVNETSAVIVAGRNAIYYELECKNGFIANATLIATILNGTDAPTYNHRDHTETPKSITLTIVKGSKPVTEVHIGEEVQLKITGIANYTVNPLECNAYDGKTGAERYPLWTQTNCSSKDHAIMDDNWTKGNGSAQIQMFAFKFVSSETVVIECSAYMCPSNDTNCNNPYTCSHSSRRRREAKLNKRTLQTGMSATVSTSFTVVDHKTDSNKSSGMMVNILLYISAFAMAFSTFRSY